MSQKAIKDGLGNNVKDYLYDPVDNKFVHKNDLVHESPLPVGMEREPKIHSPAYRRKYPERYGTKYTSKLEQALYPKAGSAPSEKEIQKRLDKVRGLSDWDAIKATAKTPEEKKDVQNIIRKAHQRNASSIARDELKYLKPEDRNLDYKFLETNVKPWLEPLPPPIPEPNFEVTPDPDLQKGLGSLLGTVKEDYKK
tara:strand:- start:243 stop:830 length:588 start_codon:yes stop_codon:yes gene_type:complete